MERRFFFNTKDLSNYRLFEHDIKAIELYNVSTLSNPYNNTIIFANKKKWDEKYRDKLIQIEDSLIIFEQGLESVGNELETNNIIFYTANPRLEFAKLIAYILSCDERNKQFQIRNDNVCVGENVEIGENTIIEPFVLIGHNVLIGDNCIIKSGVKIRNDVRIGNNVIIGENSVIGGQGFGIEQDGNGQNHRIPHIGGVIIGNNVEIGALTSISSGTIEPTVIEDYVFIDDLNHVAHNCVIGRSTMLAGITEICGSAEIGEKCYLAPMSCVRNDVKVGKESFIGQMTSITKSIPEKSTMAGNPGEELEQLKKWQKIKKELISAQTENK